MHNYIGLMCVTEWSLQGRIKLVESPGVVVGAVVEAP